MSAARLEKAGRGKVILRAACCPLPHGERVGGKLRITSRHDKERHAVDLTPEDLRRIADEIELSGGTTWRA